MNTKFFTAFFLFLFAFNCNAQSNYSTYLDKAREKIEAGDCEAAQKFYNVYKELSGQTSSLLEKSISDCNKQKNSKKTYSIGDDAKDFIGLEGYKIAYLDASGKHGFAINVNEWGNHPTMDECRIMYENRFSLGLTGEYRTTEKENFWGPWDYHSFDFSTGKKHKRKYGDKHVKEMSVRRF